MTQLLMVLASHNLHDQHAAMRGEKVAILLLPILTNFLRK